MSENKLRHIPDYHIHTELCGHALEPLASYVDAAIAKGVKEIAITDHNPNPHNFDPEHRMTMEDFETYQGWFQALDTQTNCKVLYGIEADYYPGCEEQLPHWLASHDFDIVLGSVHYLNYWDLSNTSQSAIWMAGDVEVVWRNYFSLIKRMAQTGFYDVVTHIDLPKRSGNRPSDDFVRDIACPALDAIAEADMSIEINTSGLHHPAKEMYPSPLILEEAFKRNISIVFGSDSHQPTRIQDHFEEAIALAKEIGYTSYRAFNKRRGIDKPLDA